MSWRKDSKIDWSRGPVQCAVDGCSTMLRPNNRRAEGKWTNTVQHKGRGMCFKHWQASRAEERLSKRPHDRSWVPQMTIRGTAAVVYWPLPAEGTQLRYEKQDLERWVRLELEQLGYKETGRTTLAVHHGQDPFISAAFHVRVVPLQLTHLASPGVAA